MSEREYFERLQRHFRQFLKELLQDGRDFWFVTRDVVVQNHGRATLRLLMADITPYTTLEEARAARAIHTDTDSRDTKNIEVVSLDEREIPNLALRLAGTLRS